MLSFCPGRPAGNPRSPGPCPDRPSRRGGPPFMVNRNLLCQFDPPGGERQQELDAGFGDAGSDWLTAEEQLFRENRVVTGTVLRVGGDGVWVDVGYKSEG